MKKTFILFFGLILGLGNIQAQDAPAASGGNDSKPKCCENLKIGFQGNVGIGIPDFNKLNTRYRSNELKTLPSEYVFLSNLIWVQSGKFRLAIDYGKGSAKKEYPGEQNFGIEQGYESDILIDVEHRMKGFQLGYSVLQNKKYDAVAFAGIYDHRTRINYKNNINEDIILDEYLTRYSQTNVVKHNIATLRLGASFDYYFSLGAIPFAAGASVHAGVPLTRGRWNYDTDQIRDKMDVNPMAWNLSARLGLVLAGK